METHWSVFRTCVIVTVLILCAGRVGGQSTSVTADFDSRSLSTKSIPANLFGVNLASISQAAIPLVIPAGFTQVRRTAQIPVVYANPVPDWRAFDGAMSQAKTAGLRPIVIITNTPIWLQPASNPCVGESPQHLPPTDVNKWAEIASSYVAHLDRAFPGFVQDFEIWNEPDLQTSLCVADNTDSTRLNTYLSLYAAASAAMRVQAQADNVRIRIGGPTLGDQSLAPEWIPALLSSPFTAPNVDFVSVHLYLTGPKQISSGMDWEQLYSFTQSPTRGINAYYSQVDGLVRKGSQPHASTTPIYVTEYNDNWAFAHDCCRNDPTFGPLWNSVAIVDFLNSVYLGADQLPAKIYYYAASAPPYFCFAGTWNSNMDCDPSRNDPYPQYYAYQLFSTSKYLGLTSGGHMAASVSSTNPQLLVSAFFNSAHNMFVIINPTSSSFPGTLVRAANPGFSSGVATEYLLNRQNPTIRKSYVPLTGAAAGLTTSVDVPAYSVLALSLTASQANAAPTVMLSVTPQSGTAPLAVNVDTSGSFDTGGSIVSRNIDFGDGSTAATSAAANHSYTQAGTYTVRATVIDNGGMSSQTTATVTAWNAGDYKLTASVIAETSNSFNITVTPVAQLNSPVSLSCSQAPPGAACAFSPESLTPGSKSASSTLTLVAVTSASEKGKPSPLWLAIWAMLPLGLVVTSLSVRSRSTLAGRQAIVACFAKPYCLFPVGELGAQG